MTSSVSRPPSSFEQARARARAASVDGDWPQAALWAERAWRLAGQRLLPSLELAAALARTGDRRATELLAQAAKQHADFPVLVALAAAQSRDGAQRAAQATLHRLLTTVALDAVTPASDLASEIAARADLAGWLGWRKEKLLFGTTRGDPSAISFALNGRTLALQWTSEAPQLWSASLPPAARGRLQTTPPLLGAPLRPELFRTPRGTATRSANRVQGAVWFPHDPERHPGVTITVEHRGRPANLAVQDLTLATPTETEPFARRWLFDVALRPGTTVIGVRETGSGHAIPLGSASRVASAQKQATPEPDGLQPYRTKPCVLLVTHDEGGGIERHVERRLDALRRAGKAGLLLRSQQGQPGVVRLADTLFHLPADGPALLDRLRDIGPIRIEYHQPRRHDGLVWQLASALSVPYDVYLHDYALLCPRTTLIGANGRYCGEPPVAQCDRCISSFKHRHLFAPAGVAALRQQSTALLSNAARVLAPSADIAARFRRHIPGARVTIRPWEASTHPASPARINHDQAHVCIVGALNHHKGFDILLECARDAAIRGLPIRFTVVGHTSDDEALIDAGAFVTGPYADSERAELIARQRATIGFLPSIWPEPWCYSLTGLLEAGLPTLCFDIGAQAQRVRAVGGTILPLGMSARDVNQQIVQLHRQIIRPRSVVVQIEAR